MTTEVHKRTAVIQCGSCGYYACGEVVVGGERGLDILSRFVCSNCGTPEPIIAFYTPPRTPTAEEIARADAAAEQRQKDAEDRMRNRLRGQRTTSLLDARESQR